MRPRRGLHRWAWTVVAAGLVTAAAFAAALSVTAGTAGGAFPGGNGVIAFETLRQEEFEEVYVMNPDGSGQVNRSKALAHDDDPAWSADGARIAFRATRDGNDEIYVMNADGSNPDRLTDEAASDRDPSWSPDGTRIAFTTDRDGNDEIYVMDADGSDPERLTTNAVTDAEPAWSPDGTKIAYQTRSGGGGDNDEIYVMGPDGSGLDNLTEEPTGNDQDPAWSPDGTRIVFHSDREGNDDVFTMNANGSSQVQRTTHTADDADPDWSPDGTKIAFQSDRDDGNLEIYVMDADGSDQQNISNSGFPDGAPSWQPTEAVAPPPPPPGDGGGGGGGGPPPGPPGGPPGGPLPPPADVTLRGDAAFAEGTSNDLYLACTTRNIILIDVLPAGRKRVSLTGAADLRLAGRTADVLLDGEEVGTVVIGADGLFATRVQAPKTKRRKFARYQARVGTEASQPLRLRRRMVATTLTRSGDELVLRGRVTKPFARRPPPLRIVRFLSCRQRERIPVRRVVPDRRGRFAIKVPIPAGFKAVMYRAQTKVPLRRGGPPTEPTFTLPRAIDLL